MQAFLIVVSSVLVVLITIVAAIGVFAFNMARKTRRLNDHLRATERRLVAERNKLINERLARYKSNTES